MIEDKLSNDEQNLFHPLSHLIFYGYIILTILTIILLSTINWARELYHKTEIIVIINAAWFGLSISIYGFHALRKNIRRAILSNLDIKLDTQFLIVSAFTLFALKQVIDLYMFVTYNIETENDTAWRSGGKILEFGGFMCGLGSIYSSRRR